MLRPLFPSDLIVTGEVPNQTERQPDGLEASMVVNEAST